MLNNIVGIKYIGNKPSKVDNVANTGAVWAPGEVHNFSSAIAQKLLAYPTVFELADISQSGSTYMSDAAKVSAPQKEPIAFVNLHNMDSKALAAYARLHFNRTLDDKEKPEVLRNLVSKLMSNATLDEIQEELQEQERKAGTRETEFIGLEVSQEEYDLYRRGDLVLKLVPVYTGTLTSLSDEENTQSNGDGSGLTELEQRADAEADASRQQLAQAPAESAPEQAPAPAAPQPEKEQDLADILAQLEKPQLLKLAKEQGVKVSNTMTAEVLRAKLLEKK